MHQLEEIPTVEEPGGLVRRCFTCPDLQLYVWQQPDGTPTTFQLACEEANSPRVIEYRREKLHHYELDRADRGFTGIDSAALILHALGRT